LPFALLAGARFLQFCLLPGELLFLGDKPGCLAFDLAAAVGGPSLDFMFLPLELFALGVEPPGQRFQLLLLLGQLGPLEPILIGQLAPRSGQRLRQHSWRDSAGDLAQISSVARRSSSVSR